MRIVLLALAVAVSLSVPVTTLTPLPQTGLPPRDRPPGEPVRGTASIRGQVFAADTGTALRRAMVRINAQGPGGRSAVAQTDSDGRFEVTDLPAGRYVIVVSRSGYVTTSAGARAPGQPGTPIELSDGQRLEKVNIAMMRGGAVTGRIVDEFGEPLSDVRVSAERMITMSGTRRLAGTSSGDMTDDLGQFRLHGLPPGEYYISATLREVMSFMPPNTASASTSIEGHAPTCVWTAWTCRICCSSPAPAASFAAACSPTMRAGGGATA